MTVSVANTVKQNITLNVYEHETYGAVSGTLNAEIVIMSMITLRGYYNKETNTFRGFLYDFNKLYYVNYENFGNSRMAVEIENVKQSIKKIPNVEMVYDSMAEDYDFKITNVTEFLKTPISFKIVKHYGSDVYSKLDNIDINELDNALVKVFNEYKEFYKHSPYMNTFYLRLSI